jgi:hypothetical protein
MLNLSTTSASPKYSYEKNNHKLTFIDTSNDLSGCITGNFTE